jgi:hypothetical protein
MALLKSPRMITVISIGKSTHSSYGFLKRPFLCWIGGGRNDKEIPGKVLYSSRATANEAREDDIATRQQSECNI